MPIKVYVAGPYSSDPEGNVLKAIDAAESLWKRGFVPYVPHLTHYWHQRHPHPWEEWLLMDQVWLAVCQAVLRLPGASPGADRECSRAHDLKIPVFESLEDLERASRAN